MTNLSEGFSGPRTDLSLDPGVAADLRAATPGRSRPLIEMKGVGMSFLAGKGRVTALSGLDIVVRRHEFLSIVGPSGCGKSTILRLVAGLLAATEGSINIDGETPQEARLSRRFGFVFQSSVMLHWRTALQNVMLPSEVMGQANDRRRAFAMKLLQQVGLQGYEGLYSRQLSGGMRQRVAIARALSYDPPIMLMDEPFGALDALTRQKLHALLLDLWEADKKTVIFITHDVSEAVLLSDRVLVMSGSPGRVDAEVPIDLPRPRTDAIKSTPAFLGLVDRIMERLGH